MITERILTPIVSFVVAGTCLAVPAAAGETYGLCGKNREADMQGLAIMSMHGPWEVTLGPGYVVTNGVALPHPGSEKPEIAHIEEHDGHFTLTPQGESGGVVLGISAVGPDEKDWRFENKPHLPEGTRILPGARIPDLPFDQNTIEQEANCPMNELPRYIGTGAATIEGVTMNFTYRLVMVNYSELVGNQEVTGTANGHPYVERRTVRMTKMDESVD